MHEADNILYILEKTKEFLDKNDAISLKELSDHTLHASSIEQDAGNIGLAVIVYSLGKLVEKQDTLRIANFKGFITNLEKDFDKGISLIKQNKTKQFLDLLESMRQKIENVSGDLKNYIEDVIRRAEINKASKLYEHGLSQARTAKLLGVTQWELAEYVNIKPSFRPSLEKPTSVKNRIKITEDILR